KKETLKVEKTQDDKLDDSDNSYDVGDTVSFTVKTTIPTFADVYENPTFKITDEMSDGLIITSGSFVVKVNGEEKADLKNKVREDSTTSWSLDLTGTDYLKLESPAPIEITYDAVLTKSAFSSVNEETNDVKVEFSNNPDDENDKGTVKDKTRTYTFSIDGNLLGKSGVRTSELVKVAVDGNGNPIIQASATGKTYENALAGAVFGLYTDQACKNVYTNKAGGEEKTWNNIVTDKDGYMEINGLDVGTYYLKEISAPAGFIADQKTHKIEISAEYDTETITEGGYTYDLPKLKSYTIKIDDATTSTYSMTLEASSITTSEATNLPTSIMNTKGIELPSTGGIGTTIFYIIGSVLVIGAGIVMVTRRRMNAN
ncbi:MAG: isopeptide-forming domain-containing fimbrial protein, partial [Parasporobacterium sp.]|nr:isopeptide-forming domain-containing fimbrial protein [Parasporobacterium sp.]